jgi:Pectinacetylesterase
MQRRSPVVVVVALAAVLAACGGDDDESSSGPDTTVGVVASPPPATDSPTTEAPTTIVSTTDAPMVQPAAFEQVVPGGDCQCSDGSEFSFWVREADPQKVLFYFQGGGACFSGETCDPASGTYKPGTGPQDDPTSADTGIWDQSNPDNPFAGWSVVYVPYCTGDVHVGNATTDYGNGLVIQHKGSVNANAAIDDLVARFPAATQVFVTGESAGGVPTAGVAALVGDRLPNARLAALADSSGAYPDVPAVNAAIGGLWGTINAVPDWPELAGLTVEQWSIPGVFTRAFQHNPAIALARFDYRNDSVQSSFTALAGLDASDLPALIDLNETQIEASGADLDSWLADGSSHTILSQDDVYTQQVGDTRLIDWIADLVDGTPVDDVRCEACDG